MGVPWADPDERAAALSQPWEAFRDAYPARSWESYRKFRKRVQVAAFDDDQLAEIEAIARDTAATQAAAVAAAKAANDAEVAALGGRITTIKVKTATFAADIAND